jgi:hypothetical protein
LAFPKEALVRFVQQREALSQHDRAALWLDFKACRTVRDLIIFVHRDLKSSSEMICTKAAPLINPL